MSNVTRIVGKCFRFGAIIGKIVQIAIRNADEIYASKQDFLQAKRTAKKDLFDVPFVTHLQLPFYALIGLSLLILTSFVTGLLRFL